jgi:uncharacterized membrane protein
MSPIYYLTVTLHLLAAFVWLGGMIAFALLAPALRSLEDDDVRQRIFQMLGERFRAVGWVCIAVLLITGVGQLHFRGWWGPGFWGVPGFWGTDLGVALAGKLTTVGFMVTAQGLHDFWLGPEAGRAVPQSDEARVLRRRAALLARGNAAVGLVLIYFAVRLARGG